MYKEFLIQSSFFFLFELMFLRASDGMLTDFIYLLQFLR